MLTGDKLETATCIAKSSHLVSRAQDIHIFRPVSIATNTFYFSSTTTVPSVVSFANDDNNFISSLVI